MSQLVVTTSYPTRAPEVIAQSQRVLSTHGRTFRLASHLLPADQRDDAGIVYAFCRLVDDLADEAPDQATALEDLAQVAGMLRGQVPASPLVAAYLGVCRHGAIDLIVAEDLIRGVVGDLGEVCFETDAELVRYGYRVAGTVGVMMCGVLGVRDKAAWAHAVDLGVAMQITNICRDVAADAAMGRVYLPARRLDAAGISSEELLEGRADRGALATVVVDLLDVADRYYASARVGLAYLPARVRYAIAVAARVYRAIRFELQRQAFDPFAGRAVVPTHRRIAHALAACLSTGADSVVGWAAPRAFEHDRALHHELTDLVPSAGVHPELVP